MADFGGVNAVTWQVNNTWLGMTRVNVQPSLTASLTYYTQNRKFSPEKTYLFKTKVNNFNYSLGNSYKQLFLNTPWDSFTYSINSGNVNSKLPIANDSDVYLTYYSKPPSNINSNFPIRYDATYNGFATSSGSTTASVIKSIDIIEFDWVGQGWSLATSSVYPNRYQGWTYVDSNNSFTFTRYNGLVPKAGDHTRRNPGDKFTETNYIAKYIPYSTFNLSFNYTEAGSPNYAYVDLFLVNNLTSLNTLNLLSFTTSLNNGQFLGRIGVGGFTASNYEFYNLTGNQYLLFQANWEDGGVFNIITNWYQFSLSNIQVTGGYNENDNNEQFLFTNTNEYYSPTTLSLLGGDSSATYSSLTTTPQTLHYNGTEYFGATDSPAYYSNIYGQVINLSEQNSKIGNGNFKSGVWENGVWNSGYRVDEQVYEFNEIVAAFTTTTKNYKWRIQISGPTQSVENFSVGDKVSIGNIVSININNERKLLKKFFTVILKDENNIVVEIENNFPIRRVIKDSENHKIRVTKNVWLSGAFLNGYFEGIWNNGLVKGYPMVTELYNTHWIDGTFDGGHFNSDYTFYDFIETIYTNGYVGLSFSNSTPHNLLVGDLIIIDKDDKTVNPDYDGTASVVSILDEYFITTDLTWGQNTSTESGVIRRYYSKSLLQNVTFYDNNVAPKNSKQSQTLKDIWRFNSWMDLNYSTYSTVTINSEKEYLNNFPQSTTEFVAGNFGYGPFTAPNLYGFSTDDVMSSESYFRDIDSFSQKKYTLGSKYEIYQDFLGDISEFNKPFGTTSSSGGLDGFIQDGWTFSFSGEWSFLTPGLTSTLYPYTFSRTTNATLKYQSSELLSTMTFDNTNINIEKKRYSIIEFDLLDSQIILFPSSPAQAYLFNWPFFVDESGTFNYVNAFPDSTLPVTSRTPGTKKRFYFYNRQKLNLGLIGTLNAYYELDNIKFYEVDSIPFFSYTTEDYVNKQVQVPYQARAPFIDYNNLNFSFVENITFGFDSISVNASSIPTTQTAITTGIAYS